MADRWKLQEELRSGQDVICAGIIEGPGGAYCDFSDSKSWSRDEIASMERLIADANTAAVYRKALEPLAAEFRMNWMGSPQHTPEDVWLSDEHVTAMREAVRLMELLPENEEPGEK
jgi:hypothetical protein